MKKCCFETWWETNVAIRMISWEITRKEWGGDRYSQNIFPISYTCYKYGRKWSNLTSLIYSDPFYFQKFEPTPLRL
jgi:hypothetical protein